MVLISRSAYAYGSPIFLSMIYHVVAFGHEPKLVHFEKTSGAHSQGQGIGLSSFAACSEAGRPGWSLNGYLKDCARFVATNALVPGGGMLSYGTCV